MTIHSEKNHSTIPRRGRQYDNGHRNRRHGIKGGNHQFYYERKKREIQRKLCRSGEINYILQQL